MSVVILDFGNFVEAMKREYNDFCQEYAGWYCINIKPVKCSGCGHTVAYLEPPDYHLIVVWEEKDDPQLLKFATLLKKMQLEPRVETYYPILGSCVPWNEVEELYEGLTQ